jgi:hypothetical protein
MSGLGGFLFDNLGLKLVAVLLALVVYLHVYTERPATMTLSFPVEARDVPDSLVVTAAEPAAVAAELRGTGKQLIRLRLTEPRVRLSLAGARSGTHLRRITGDDLPVGEPGPLEVVRLVGAEEVEFRVERIVSRSVRVVARFGGLPAGAPLPAWSAQPASVLLRGPRTTVAGIDSLVLEPVRMRGGRDTTRVLARVVDLPANCTADPEAVVVRATPAPPAGH